MENFHTLVLYRIQMRVHDPQLRHAQNPEPAELTNSIIFGCLTNKYAANGTLIEPPVTDEMRDGMFSISLG